MKRLSGFVCIGALVVGALPVTLTAQGSVPEIYHVRVLETDDFFNPINLDGVAFPPNANSVLRLNKNTHGPASIELVSNDRNPGDSANIRLSITDPLNLTFDDQASTVFLLEEKSIDLFSTLNAANGNNPTTLGNVSSARFGITEPVGVATHSELGTIFVLDRNGSRLSRIRPIATQNSANANGLQPAAVVDGLQHGTVSTQTLDNPGTDALRGLAYNPENNRLYTINTITRQLFAIDNNGQLVLAGNFPPSLWNEPEAVVFAPSLDQTDDPDRWHLFIASSAGVSGEVSEWSIVQPDAVQQ